MLFRSIRQACHGLLVAAALLQVVDCLGVDTAMAGDASPVDIASLRSLPLPALGASPGSVADHRVVVRGVVTWLTRGEVTHD
jgi:hypothetical protein